MAKKIDSNQQRIIHQFVENPLDAGIAEILPLIPAEQLARGIERQYKLKRRSLDRLSATSLRTVGAACAILSDGGLSPEQYDYDAWLGTAQSNLEGYSPLRRASFEEQEVIDFATLTVERFKEITTD